ncbi:MAG: heme-binding protein [Flavobacteriales bacterium]|nr:heme-binding protein [Flavobacteriales bacterium]
MRSSKGIEVYGYEVIESYKDFEVRRYEPATFSYVKMNAATYREVSSQGFRTLAGYIFGGNAENQKIAMTSPVAMEMDDSVTMSFMVPSDLKAEELPKPNDQRIGFRTEPEKVLAAIQFGGWANDEKITAYSTKLIEALQREGFEATGKITFMGYNPPYEVVNRRNEIVVEITYPEG